MKYFSMFSGIGGFELGIYRAYVSRSERIQRGGISENTNLSDIGEQLLGKEPFCVGYSEIEKNAVKVYERHFKGHKNYGDATRIVPEQLPDFDFLCGGFPCQAFSIAGKRGGFKDTRGTLFFEIARILSVKRPKLLLLENVKGLLSHDSGRTFGTILATLSELGYFCEWQVLNSKDFGVPQNRERVFIVGHLGNGSGRKVFPIYTGNGKVVEKEYVECISGTLSTKNQSGQAQWDASTTLVIPVLTPNRAEKRQNGRRMKEDGEERFTVTAQDQHGVYDGHRIRRLTPTECERLQGFPDGWTEGLSDSARYKCLGNAVTVNVIEAIVERIML